MPDISPYTGVLGNRLAAHLLRRTTFGPTKSQIVNLATKTPAQALTDLLTFNPITTKPIDPQTNGTWVDNTTVPPANSSDFDLRNYILSWFLENCRIDNTIRSKMMVFLHQNWIVDDEAWVNHDLYDHLKLLEFYSLGSYKTLSKKMCTDNRMLIYLNGYQNSGNNPNENYAREFLELFTIGKGPQTGAGNYTTYTENDIKEAAKLLSGYTYLLSNTQVDPDTSIRRCNIVTSRHSTATKIFSGAFQNTQIAGTSTAPGMLNEISLFVDMVFNQDATALNIARKLYRYFVNRTITPPIETDIIVPLASTLKTNNYDLKVALNQLLQSKHFYDMDDASNNDNKIGSVIKSPLELIMNTLRFFSISPFDLAGNTPFTIWEDFYWRSIKDSFCDNSQMSIFNSTTVAGYPPYYSTPNYDRLWFASNSITQRYYIGRCLLENKRLPYSSWASFGAKIDIVLWIRNNISNPANGNAVVDELVNYLLPEIPSVARRTYFLNQTLLGTLSLTNWSTEWNNYINPVNPNNPDPAAIVRPRLELLFKAILFSQEYQLQ